MRDAILIVSGSPKKIAGWVASFVSHHSIEVLCATSGMEGYEIFEREKPFLLLVDADLPDMTGASLATVLKDTQDGRNTTIYLYNVRRILQNTKADFYFTAQDDKELHEIMKAQIQSFMDKHYLSDAQSHDILMAVARQYAQLPKPIYTDEIEVRTLFSPMSDLSGDNFDYWLDLNRNHFYGFLLDCTGHGIASFTQVGSVRTLLKKACSVYQHGYLPSLGKVMEDVNNDLFSIDNDPTPACAILFDIDLTKKRLLYCSSAIPSFYFIRAGSNRVEEVKLQNYPLAAMEEVEFQEDEMDLTGIRDLIFASDGFSELFLGKRDENSITSDIAKHDDVSAVMIRFPKAQPPDHNEDSTEP